MTEKETSSEEALFSDEPKKKLVIGPPRGGLMKRTLRELEKLKVKTLYLLWLM